MSLPFYSHGPPLSPDLLDPVSYRQKAMSDYKDCHSISLPGWKHRNFNFVNHFHSWAQFLNILNINIVSCQFPVSTIYLPI